MNVFKRFRPGYELVTEHFEWRVQVPFLQTSDRNGKQIESLLFACHEDPDSRWRLRLTDQKTKLSIHMWRCNSEGQNVIITDRILVKISILGGDKKKVLRQLTTTKPNSQMLKVFFYKDEVKLINSECRQDDGSYTFRCRILCHVKMENIASADVPSGLSMDCSDGLATDFEELFDTMQMSDVIFNFGDRQFPAHKLILAARSEVFAAMFQHPTTESLTNRIRIQDVEPEVFHELLRFIYTGRVSLEEKMDCFVARLFLAADKYLLDELKNQCENCLLQHMSPDNSAFLLLHVDLTNPSKYLNGAAKFFRRYPSQVMATDGWQRMKQENPASLLNILECVYRYK